MTADQGLLCVIDDAQWIDEESLAALAFVGRRLSADRIGLLFGVRDGVGATDALGGLPTIAVDGLPEDAALDLLSTRTDVEVDAGLAQRTWWRRAAARWPSVELALDLTDDQLRGGRVVPEPLPIGERLEEHFLRQVRALDEPAQRFALIVAADTSGDAALVRQVAADLATTTDPVADVGVAEDAVVAARLLTLAAGAGVPPPADPLRGLRRGSPSTCWWSVHTALAVRIDLGPPNPTRRAAAPRRRSPGPGRVSRRRARAGRGASRQARAGYSVESSFLLLAAQLTPTPAGTAARRTPAAPVTRGVRRGVAPPVRGPARPGPTGYRPTPPHRPGHPARGPPAGAAGPAAGAPALLVAEARAFACAA